jgi:hypothetical protein
MAETRLPDEAVGTMAIAINGETKKRLNILQEARGPRRALDFTHEDIEPENGVIEIRFSGNDGREAVAQAIEILPAK